ncbi:MAG: cryptochrome/photolyase family protein [Acidimicrobiia bacterium]
METVWVLGDQLHRAIGALADATPSTHRVLLVESRAKVGGRHWHVQRAHFLLTSMRRFADALRAEGFVVDYRVAGTFNAGFRGHIEQFSPDRVVVTEPNSRRARELLASLGVGTVRSDQFLCHHAEFAEWADTRKALRLEDFYRHQRTRLGYLMDGDEPAGGRWNYDAENREPPPRGTDRPWPAPPVEVLDDLDRAVLADLPSSVSGEAPVGTWATSRAGALRRLTHFVTDVLPMFGPHEDAMLSDNWHLAHSMLSPYLNNGLLLPGEVCDAVERAYRDGRVPIASAEGFIRQVIGWREYVWGLYWLWMPDYRDENALAAQRDLPPAFTIPGATNMRCVASCVQDLEQRGWLHHIQRLMVLGNLSLLAGVSPRQVTDWMWERFVDGAEWVMVPNVVGMALYADGGRMSTKPYAAGGAYIDRMSDYCKGCAYDRKRRVGDTACPFTTLYWDFLLRHADRLARNARTVVQVRAAQKLTDGEAVRLRAGEVLRRLDAGTL